ncbi:hypothetical protein [Pseudozobellia thermophila]|uniref:LTXXQ motif family protein n=1 Tax=Pseudozobellia thermophila TaxID=192903 RepID=A0A1M6PB28_9FLAO|nr:hypothetical protein [Pseudozobellia thermophila]SHK05138.1 hypothetical protein SAMN04488513_11925 [Pseudozobellia thermophila]
MKKSLFRGICLVLACAASSTALRAQENEKKHEVTKYTIMERFEPELVLTPEERVQLKEERVAEISKTKEIVDTLDISERKREKLLNDILKKPYSPRLSRTMAKLEFEDGDIE